MNATPAEPHAMRVPSTILRRCALVAAAAVIGCLALPVRAAETVQISDNVYNYLEMLRSDLNSTKVEIVNGIMNLSATDAEKFWPLYREYEAALADQSLKRAEFVVEFVNASRAGTFDDALAKSMAARWFELQRNRLDLLEKYHREIEKSLSSVQAGQFLQIENQLTLFVDLTIAGEMPFVGESSP